MVAITIIMVATTMARHQRLLPTLIIWTLIDELFNPCIHEMLSLPESVSLLFIETLFAIPGSCLGQLR
jgi:hypothetical protein